MRIDDMIASIFKQDNFQKNKLIFVQNSTKNKNSMCKTNPYSPEKMLVNMQSV